MKLDRDIVDAFCEEAKLRADLESAVTMKCELENKLQDPKETQAPFMSRMIKRAHLNSDHEKYLAAITLHRKHVFDLRTQLLELQNKVDVLIFQHLQRTDAIELRETLKISGFYGLSYKRISAFQVCLRQFRIHLGSARAEMSASYKKNLMTYSGSTQESMQEALLAAKELDEAIHNINDLSREFEVKAFGLQVASSLLPRFNERGFEDLIMEAFLLQIAQAHPELEQILKDCEELDSQEISAAYVLIEDAQEAHQEQTDALVRKIWQEAQQQHFSEENKANL